MSMKISQTEGNQFKAEYRGVEVISGRVKEGSQYVGMSPGSLMVASLGMCTGMHISSYLSNNGIPHEGIDIDIKNKYERNPPRAAEFILTVNVKGDLTEEQKMGLKKEAKRCYVGNTMRNSPQITVNLE